jgi:subtilisin family serine protease
MTTRDKRDFDPDILNKAIIAIPLLERMKENPDSSIDLIIDLNFNYRGGRQLAMEKILVLLEELQKTWLSDKKNAERQMTIYTEKTKLGTQYVFAKLPVPLIKTLVEREDPKNKAIYKIWPDFEVKSQMLKSLSTVKADAARISFSALGEKITWAVVDSGIDFKHRHFKMHKNESQAYHLDLTGGNKPGQDDFGHGTHVAGIIAGEMEAKQKSFAVIKSKNENGDTLYSREKLERISGVAPRCRLVSIKVLDGQGVGLASSVIAAINHIQEVNNHGRDIKIHGVNLSLGYTFDPEWFACGQSPLCVEVNRLVKSGVVVVAAAGNTGYGYSDTKFNGRMATGMPLSINDPGNADLAITVGSTHKEMPHTFGVSYFSSKGPTGDGRMKPDLVAPGEKIISCAAGKKKDALGIAAGETEAYYLQESGTSMAAPHVSGAIAAFLSIRREYIGQPEKVKDIFISSATDLIRDRYFQGKGWLDRMRAIQSI